jgi:hypothetical protein
MKFTGPRTALADDGVPPVKRLKKQGQMKAHPLDWTDGQWTTGVNRHAAFSAAGSIGMRG